MPDSDSLGVIFDVDGVLVDSYHAHLTSWQIAAGEFGFRVTEEDFVRNFGRKSHETIAERWGDRLSPEEVTAFEHRKEAAYRDVIREAFPAMPGARELISGLHAAGFLLAVASSGPPENVGVVLDQLGQRPLFQAVITGDDVTRGKPDPQVFLLAAERLGLPPGRAAVIEDSPPGIAAAKAAGMLAIGLVSTGHSWESLSQADQRVNTLGALSPETVRGWLIAR